MAIQNLFAPVSFLMNATCKKRFIFLDFTIWIIFCWLNSLINSFCHLFPRLSHDSSMAISQRILHNDQHSASSLNFQYHLLSLYQLTSFPLSSHQSYFPLKTCSPRSLDQSIWPSSFNCMHYILLLLVSI
jgi:hypothetical protein